MKTSMLAYVASLRWIPCALAAVKRGCLTCLPASGLALAEDHRVLGEYKAVLDAIASELAQCRYGSREQQSLYSRLAMLAEQLSFWHRYGHYTHPLCQRLLTGICYLGLCLNPTEWADGYRSGINSAEHELLSY